MGKRTKPEPIQMPAGDDGFCDRVFVRIGEPLPDKIASPEDYALDLLFARDYQVRSVTWNRMLDHKYGRPSVKRGVARGAESNSDAKTVLLAKRLYLPEWRREVIEKLQRGERNNSSPEIFPES